MEAKMHAGRLPVVPDRSLVTTSMAREALDGILTAGWRDKRFGDLDVRAAWVLAMLLRLYAEMGMPPSSDKIAAAAGLSESETDMLLDQLCRRDLAIRGEGGQTISGAYPFTEAVTGHTVNLIRTEHSLNTMCFIDALGAGAMCRENTIVRSACHGCGAPVVAQVGELGTSLTDVQPWETVVWVGFKSSCGCAANSLCRELVPFCSTEHLDQWLASGGHREGRRLAVEEALEVGRALFADRALLGGD